MSINTCNKCGEFKSLVGTYTFRERSYTYKACPKCYPARTNVVNALNRLAVMIELGT